MDWKQLTRLRQPGFTVARRGYDRREVDHFLGSLVEWLENDAPTELGDMAVKRELELVGRSTTRILVTTEEESAKLRRRAKEDCDDLRAMAEAASVKTREAADEYARKAEAASVKTREAADEYARKVRAKADEAARRSNEAAVAKAAGIVEEGERRRTEIEAVVSQLETHRDATLRELEGLRAQLSSTIGAHASGARPKPRSAANPAKQTDAPGEQPEAPAEAGTVAQA